MRPGVDFDETRTAFHMPSKARRQLLLSSAAAKGYVVKSWDVPGVYMNAPSDPMFRITMKQPPMADGSYKEPGKICVLRRAIPGDPTKNAQWGCVARVLAHKLGIVISISHTGHVLDHNKKWNDQNRSR